MIRLQHDHTRPIGLGVQVAKNIRLNMLNKLGVHWFYIAPLQDISTQAYNT